jgi:DNA-binding PadR family transcriptional regulator
MTDRSPAQQLDPASCLPLTPVVFAILLALSTGEKHGYAIMKSASQTEGGAVTMGPGTLYGSIDRMIRDSLIEETGYTDDDRRRYYRITSFGLKVFAAEASRLRAALASIKPRRSSLGKPSSAGART